LKRSTVIVYWLIPSKPERELFRAIIGILARQLDAPRFEPHLTISATRENPRSVRETFKRIRLGPIRLRFRSVDWSNRFTKTLFVRFQRNRALDQLNAGLHRAAGIPAGVLRDPHVSLLYKQMSMSAKKQLATTIKLPFSRVSFDSIKAVRCAAPTQTGADVKAWKVVATKSLAK
jgi:hypothetical protein